MEKSKYQLYTIYEYAATGDCLATYAGTSYKLGSQSNEFSEDSSFDVFDFHKVNTIKANLSKDELIKFLDKLEEKYDKTFFGSEGFSEEDLDKMDIINAEAYNEEDNQKTYQDWDKLNNRQ